MGKHYMPMLSNTAANRKLAVRHAQDALKTSTWLLDKLQHDIVDDPGMNRAERAVANIHMSLLEGMRSLLSASYSRACSPTSEDVADITEFFDLYDAFLNEALRTRRR
ncbi:MAG: hypothetical protein ACN6RK_05035 [Stenotrophomonas sp.]